MAANKRKLDEKHLKLLREMAALPHNKQCLDCHQRGPTYVNMLIGSFVCTSCSGLLRGLNPPHRVKSISMTSFTPDEMEFLRSRGNEFCRKVWLGLYDARTNAEPDSKDEQKIRDFMAQKYEKKRWYIQPTEIMHEEARKSNTPVRPENTKPMKTLGNHIPNIIVNKSQTASITPTAQPTQLSIQRPVGGTVGGTVGAAPVQSSQPQPPPAAPSQPKTSALDLLGALGGDPFAGPAPASQTTTPSGGGFADFSNFGSSPQPSSQATFPSPGGPAVLNPVASGTPSSAAPPSGGFANFPSAGPATTTTTTSASTTPSQDKYAALANLDSVFGGGPTAPVNWDSSFGGPNMTTSSSGGGWAMSSSSNNAAFGGMSSTSESGTWKGGDPFHVVSPSGDPFQAAPFPGSKASTNPFRQSPSAVNPFGTNTATFSQPASTPAVSNPFGQSPAMSQQPSSFAQFGTSQPSVASNNGFGAFGQTTSSTASPGQYGMQNGGFGAPTPAHGWPQPPPQQGQMNAFGAVAPNAFGQPPAAFPQQPQQQFGGWGAPPAGNPFMSAASQQPVPPRSSSTNPFL